jgi:hypothetical protein
VQRHPLPARQVVSWTVPEPRQVATIAFSSTRRMISLPSVR